MKYLVNRETKEHEVYDGQNYDATKYRVVEADADGWVKWDGGECPLPGSAMCEIKTLGNPDGLPAHTARLWAWGQTFTSSTRLTHYRPVLDKPDKEFLEACNNSAGAKFAECWNADIDSVFERAIEEAAAAEGRLPTLLERLKSAHEAAQRIPDLEAELREVLDAMGYDLVSRSPFVERMDIPSEKWAKGYLVTCIDNDGMKDRLTVGRVYQVARNNPDLKTIVIEMGDKSRAEECNARRFRFHSRPEVKS